MGRKKTPNSQTQNIYQTKTTNKKSDNLRILQSIKNTLPIIIPSIVILASFKKAEANPVQCNPSLEDGLGYEKFSYNAIKNWLFDSTPFFGCRLLEIKSSCLSNLKEQWNQQKIDAMEHYFTGSFWQRSKLNFFPWLKTANPDAFNFFCLSPNNEIRVEYSGYIGKGPPKSATTLCPSVLRDINFQEIWRCSSTQIN